MARTIGIDFGTAFATAAGLPSHQGTAAGGARPAPVILARIPAVARMLHGGGALCGEEAFAARSAYALSTVDQVKRFLGRTREEIRGALGQVAWTIQPSLTAENTNRTAGVSPVPSAHDRRDAGGTADFRIDAWTGLYEPESVAAEILKTLKRQAEGALGESVAHAVFTIPAAATNRQRLALKEAARRAGLCVRRILNEPAALAIAEAWLRPPLRANERWAIVSFGAGMTDVAIADIQRGNIAVRAVAGDTGLGLAAIRQRLVAQLEARFRKRHGVGFDNRPEVRAELLWIAEEVLQGLCARTTHRTDLRRAGTAASGLPLDLDETLGPRDLDAITRPAIRRLRQLCLEALNRSSEFRVQGSELTASRQDAGATSRTRNPELRTRNLSRVVLSGGGAFLPPVRKAVAEIFQRNANDGQDARATPAFGAALLAAALDGRIGDLSLQDVLAQGLGITLVNDGFSTLLAAGHPLPAHKSGTYTTVQDFQESIRFEVREGDQLCASRNHALGNFVLKGIRRARAGQPSVQVAFTIDESGILHVQAQDADTRARQDVLIERNSSGF